MKVVCEMRSNGKTLFYTVQDESGKTANIRPDQLADFCILRTFDNAVCQDGRLVPSGDGFDVVTDVPSAEQRKHDLRSFVDQLMHTDIWVTAVERNGNVRCDPDTFQLEADGYTGYIRIMPGTEGFNVRITEHLHFTNVRPDVCRSVDGSRGYGFNYLGWRTSCGKMVSSLNYDCDFRIDETPYYLPTWMDGRGYTRLDVEYLVYVKGNINGCAVIGKNNRILDTVVFKQKV